MSGKSEFFRRFQEFFLEYLPKVKGVSRNTIVAYRYAFIAFFRWLTEHKNIRQEDFTLEQYTSELVTEFLSWSAAEEKVSDSTRNQRQSAINGFASYLTTRVPELTFEMGRILNIPIKKPKGKIVSYIKAEGINLILKQIDVSTLGGRRDYAAVLLMALLGLRASEVTGLRVSDLSFAKPPTLSVFGKGSKTRTVPLNERIINALQDYMDSADLHITHDNHRLLFPNRQGQHMTRQNISLIVKKYAAMARKELVSSSGDLSLIPESISPHMLRHSAAMNMLSNGKVTLLIVKDILGHTSVRATEVYAKATGIEKQKAIDAATAKLIPSEKPRWKKMTEKSVIDFLKSDLNPRS